MPYGLLSTNYPALVYTLAGRHRVIAGVLSIVNVILGHNPTAGPLDVDQESVNFSY